MSIEEHTEAVKTATYLQDWSGRPEGDARVYEVNPPVTDTDGNVTSFVIVSAVPYVLGGDPETYIFAAKRKGRGFDIADWCELHGSFQGAMDHELALSNMGYEVAK